MLKFNYRILIPVLALAMTTGLSAGKLRLNIGYWPGELESEQEPRQFQDDILAGTGIGRLNFDWSDRQTNTIYPLGFEYFVPMGMGEVVIGANYIRYNPEYKVTGFWPAGAISLVTLENFVVEDWEAQVGYQIPLLDKRLLFTPKVGFRQNFTSYEYNELTLGSFAQMSLPSTFEAQGRNLFVGASAQFTLVPQLHLSLEYMQASPAFANWGGSMEQKRVIIGTGTLFYEKSSSDAEIKTSRTAFGFTYDVSQTIHLHAGVREEVQTVSYPGYFGLPIVVAAGSANIASNFVAEFITDKFIWEAEQKTRKGFVYFGVSYDLNI